MEVTQVALTMNTKDLENIALLSFWYKKTSKFRATKCSSTCNTYTTLSRSVPPAHSSLAVLNSRRIGARHPPADPAAEAAEIPPSGHSAVGNPPPSGSKWGGRSGWGGGSERKWIGGPPKSSSLDEGRWWLRPLRAGRSGRGQQPLLPPLCGSF